MTVHEIARLPQLETVQLEEDRTADRVFCCDMLSIAMARAPEDSIWVTVSGDSVPMNAPQSTRKQAVTFTVSWKRRKRWMFW